MRRLLFLSLLVPGVLAAQTAPLGPRVGETIDAYERTYFGLFPQTEGFLDARLVERGGSVEATLNLEGGGSQVLVLPPVVAGAVRGLLANYEDFSATTEAYAGFAESIPALTTFIGRVEPRVAMGRSLNRSFEVTTSDGSVQRVAILRVEDGIAYVWMGETPFILADVDQLVALPIAEVVGIENRLREAASVGRVLTGAAVATLGSGAGMAVGGPGDTRSAVSATVLSLAQGGLVLLTGRSDASLEYPRAANPQEVEALFTRSQRYAQAPPEVRALIKEGRARPYPLGPRQALPTPPQGRLAPSTVRVSVTGAGRLTLDPQETVGTYASGLGTTIALENTRTTTLRYHLDAAYRMLPRLSIGADLGLALQDAGGGFEPSTATRSAVGYAELDVITPSLLTPQPFGVSFAGGVGAGSQTITMDIVLPPPVAGGVPIEQVPTQYSSTSSGLAWMGRASLSYHFNTRVAVQANATVRGVPSASIEAVRFLSPGPGSKLVLFEWDEITSPSRFAEFSVGTRIAL